MKRKNKLTALFLFVFLLFSGLASAQYRTRLFDTNFVFYLQLMWNEAGAANRTLNFLVNGANRSIDLSGDLTVEASSIVNQDLSSDAAVTFLSLVGTGVGGLTTGTVANLGKLVIFDGSDHTITITAPGIAGNYVLTLPINDGGAGEYLQTDGAGALSWATPAGAGDMLAATYDADVDGDIDQDAGGTELDTSGVTDGQLLIGTTAGNVWALATVTATANQTSVANGASSITIGTVQDIAAGSSPTFVTAKLSGLTDGYIPYHVADATGLANSVIFQNGTDIGIGTVNPALFVEVQKDQNAETSLGVDNNTAGTAAVAAVRLDSDATKLVLRSLSSAYTTANQYIADSNLIESESTASGGFSISQQGALPIKFWTNAVERGRFVDGGFGLGTATVPHGGIGYAKLAIDGTDSSSAGPHVQFTTASDDYPLLQIRPYTHDSVAWYFDSYFDGANKSSDAGSNYRVVKVSDLFKIQYDSGVAQGGAVTFNDGITLDTSGNFYIKTSNAELRLYEAANYIGFEAPALGADQIWILPNADGNNLDVLTTDGAGNLTWSVKGGGGAATDVYKTIDVPAGANTVASGATDTLFLTSGSANLTITGTAATDTIDFDFSATPTFTGLTINGNIIVTGDVDGADVSDLNTAVGLNTTHRGSNGNDHSNVVLNNTHRGSNGNDHSNVVLNNTHRGSNGTNHSFIDQSVIEGASVLFEEIGPVGDGDLIHLDVNDLLINGNHTATSYTGENVTSGVDPGHTHTVASLEIDGLLSLVYELEARIQYLESTILEGKK